ncbi:hypothetical protein [Piscirickettsia salmonis]|uniref:hypothetical protein n=1 Tax=Piscirickettsia salmonis TaxID=1238 RepID=UPI0007C895D0|nr:hypothetical protein A0O36_01779 [Piscirickettsiaceae bacterium NZ-RLO1]
MAIENYEDLAKFLQENGSYSNQSKKTQGEYNIILRALKGVDNLLVAVQALESITDFNLEYWKKMRSSRSYRYALTSLYDSGLLTNQTLAQLDHNKNMRRAVSVLGYNSLLNEDNYEDLVESRPLQETIAALYTTDLVLNALDQDAFEKLKNQPLLQHAIFAANKVNKLDEDAFNLILNDSKAQKKLLLDSDEEFARQLQQKELVGSKYDNVENFVKSELLFYQAAHKNSVKPPILENIDKAPEL